MRAGKSRRKEAQGNKLRRQAEARVRAATADVSSMTEEETQRLVYELQVHQVELELQNEELREAQLELASSRDRLADLYEFAPTGYLTLDRTGLVLEANLTAASLVGIERGDLLGARFSDFVAAESQDAVYLYWRQVFSSTQRQVCELVLQRIDGEPLAVRLESRLADASPAEMPQCRVALIDVSDLKSARESLSALNLELEQRVEAQVGEIRLMANAIANLGEGLMITSDHRDWAASRIEFANQALCRMVGYTEEELIDQSPALLLGGRLDTAALDRELATTGCFRGELLYQTKGGVRRDIGLYITTLYDSGQQGIRYVAVQRDISASKQAERELREHQQRLRAILDAAVDVIITINRDGIVEDCNPAITHVFGYEVSEVLGRNISMLMPSPYRERHDDYLRRYHDTGHARVIGTNREFRARHRDGHTFPIFISINEVDHLGLFTGIIRDISDLRKLQREVLRAAGEVQWRIGQALHDGPQQALAGLSLTARGLALDLDKEDSSHGAAAAKLARELKQVNMDIQSLARGLVPVPIGNGGLMEALARLAGGTGEDDEPVVEFHCPEPVEIGNSYAADQLYLIAQEATLNAVKHSGADRIRISLLSEGLSLVLRVEDNGTGIDPTAREGPGLGMHIMPYRATTIGATLTVDSVAAVGTVVECVLGYAMESAP